MSAHIGLEDLTQPIPTLSMTVNGLIVQYLTWKLKLSILTEQQLYWVHLETHQWEIRHASKTENAQVIHFSLLAQKLGKLLDAHLTLSIDMWMQLLCGQLITKSKPSGVMLMLGILVGSTRQKSQQVSFLTMRLWLDKSLKSKRQNWNLCSEQSICIKNSFFLKKSNF